MIPAGECDFAKTFEPLLEFVSAIRLKMFRSVIVRKRAVWTASFLRGVRTEGAHR